MLPLPCLHALSLERPYCETYLSRYHPSVCSAQRELAVLGLSSAMLLAHAHSAQAILMRMPGELLDLSIHSETPDTLAWIVEPQKLCSDIASWATYLCFEVVFATSHSALVQLWMGWEAVQCAELSLSSVCILARCSCDLTGRLGIYAQHLAPRPDSYSLLPTSNNVRHCPTLSHAPAPATHAGSLVLAFTSRAFLASRLARAPLLAQSHLASRPS
jgi:hypothetical protein